MSSPPPSKTDEASSSTAKSKRVKFENGKLVEYWIDVPLKEPKSATKAASPLQLFKEFKFEEDISLGRIFPSLQNTRFDALVMKNTSMIWLGKDASALKKAGLWFETDVEFRGLLQPAADILSEVFGQEHPGIHLSAHLGIQQEWTNELIATGFTFRGSIEGINREFGEFLTFRNAGINIDVVPDSAGHTATLWSFYGKLHLAIPNSVAPLVLNYKLEPKTDSLDISMAFGEGELWESVFGVSGLNLDRVEFITSIPKSDVKTSMEFSLTAKWSLGGIPVVLSGHVSKAHASLRGYIESVSMNDLRQLFASLTGGKTLNPVEQDVRFSNITIEIAEGRLMLYGEVWVDSYKVAAAEVLISVDGISISGAVEDLHLGEDIHVENAKLEFIIGHVGQQLEDGSGNTKISTGTTPGDGPKDVPSSNPDSKEKGPKTARTGGTPVVAIIRGVVKMEVGAASLTFNIAAAIAKPAHEPVSFFVYGQLDGENLSIGSLLPDGGDLMDLNLRRVAIVASNAEVVQDYGLNIEHYPIKNAPNILMRTTFFVEHPTFLSWALLFQS
ncbi:hypothetical protein B0H16DRAFT_1477788 [Mycena metata]|uniref:Uncharacterized protein n=1 Tax=Mycena metata TaxID=1033252 RepID=A0AAD7H974_9AGAR|nr:hypothetical protein B0H16DRAFT_1477788 [Mycena metata]